MIRRTLFVSFLTVYLVLLALNSLQAAGKPDVTSHEATFLESAVNMHIEWQSPNPIVAVRISLANKQQDIKVDSYDNRRNPSGYEGEVTVTIALDWVPTLPFNYVVQLEDELRIKSALVTGKVKVTLAQPLQNPQQPSMQIQIQSGQLQSTIQPPQPADANRSFQLDIKPGQQAGTIMVFIIPQVAADSGAMWRVGNNPWKKSAEAIPNLLAGSYTIEYQDIANWIRPENQKVTIGGGQTLTFNGIYNRK